MWIGLSEPSPGSWSCHGRPSHGSDALLCGGCGAVMLPRYPGDWLSGRAPRSHRGGHWFDPSIAHGPASAARRSLIGFAEGRDTFRGPSPRTPTICGCGPVFGFCPVGPRPPDPRNWRYRSAISFPFGSASRPRPPMGGTGRLFGFWSEPLSSATGGCGLGSIFSSQWLRVGFACLPGAVLARGAETPGAPAIGGTG